ncbi:MAG TPA: hypothetical protein QGF58_29560 [Myxococcota bacterium]|nr:hypothetical protein [Myxococcota bacterium]
MTERPPDDIDLLLRGLEEALAGAGVDIEDPGFWDQVRDEVDDAVADAIDQKMQLLDGGGEDSALPTDRSHLRIAEDGEGRTRQVRVVRVRARDRVRRGGDGRIDVEGGGWQTIVRADTPRCYRIHVRAGVLDVALDGQLADRVASGQSLDVEAALVRVCGVDGASKGSFERLA